MNELLEHFNIKVIDISSLDGDINYSNIKYALKADNDKRYILKIYPDNEELILAKEESKILNDIGSGLSFKVPQTIATADNKLFFRHEKGEAKLLDYIEGDFIANVPHTEELLFSLGEKIAELNIALSEIKSPLLASRKLFWDLQNASFSYQKAELIKEPERRKLIDYYFGRFKMFVLPHLHLLRHSIIHGDLNDYNILVKDGKIEGFLDFGDSTYTPLINELAIAMTYMILGKQDSFEQILPLLKGYHKINPLTKLEVELLPELITTRLCISLCNSAEKKHTGQDNEYVLISEEPAWTLIEKWVTINPLRIKKWFLEATGIESDVVKYKKDDLLSIRNKTAGKSLALSYKVPVYMTGATFQYMFDEAGNTYLDAYNNIPHVGHCHPKISEALSKQAFILNTNTRYLYDSYAGYTEKLLGYFPSSLNKVFFVNSGSEATDLAIRMARTFNQRNHVAILEQGYHGNTTLGIEVSSYKFDGKGGKGKAGHILKLPLPKLFQGKYTTGIEFAEEAKNIIQEAIDSGNHPAAFIAEPISGCGGQVPLAPGYLKTLKPFLEEQNILTIVDEVQTGFGRTGEYFWAFQLHDIIPDIVILGKPMGNGHPIAAVVTTEKIAGAFANGMEFFSSFGGNPVSCEVATAVLNIIEEEQLQLNAKIVGNYFKEQLETLKTSYSTIGDIRGHGLFIGIEFIDENLKPNTNLASHVKNFLKDKFILTGTDGPFDNVLKIKPPMCFSKLNVDVFIEKLKLSLK